MQITVYSDEKGAKILKELIKNGTVEIHLREEERDFEESDDIEKVVLSIEREGCRYVRTMRGRVIFNPLNQKSEETPVPKYTIPNCTPDECDDCHVVSCPVYLGCQTFDEYWGKTDKK